LDNFVVSFDVKEVIMPAPKPAVKEEIKPKAVPKPKPEPMPEPKLGPIIAPAVSKPTIPERKIQVASEYAAEEAMPSIKPKEKLEPTELVSKMQLITDAKVAFVISGIIDHFADVWISKKEDGSFAVEEMNGPICNFAIREGGKINFKSGSFSGIDLKVKTAIQRKFIELTKLL